MAFTGREHVWPSYFCIAEEQKNKMLNTIACLGQFFGTVNRLKS